MTSCFLTWEHDEICWSFQKRFRKKVSTVTALEDIWCGGSACHVFNLKIKDKTKEKEKLKHTQCWILKTNITKTRTKQMFLTGTKCAGLNRTDCFMSRAPTHFYTQHLKGTTSRNPGRINESRFVNFFSFVCSYFGAVVRESPSLKYWPFILSTSNRKHFNHSNKCVSIPNQLNEQRR